MIVFVNMLRYRLATALMIGLNASQWRAMEAENTGEDCVLLHKNAIPYAIATSTVSAPDGIPTRGVQHSSVSHLFTPDSIQ